MHPLGAASGLLEKAIKFAAALQDEKALWPPYVEKLRNGVWAAWESAGEGERQASFLEILKDENLSWRVIETSASVPASTAFDLMVANRRRYGYSKEHRDSLPILALVLAALEKGADPNAIVVEPLTRQPFSVLEFAISGCSAIPNDQKATWTTALLRAGADPSLKGHPEHGPPLELALRQSTPEVLTLLLDAGASHEGLSLLARRAPCITAAVRAWNLENNWAPAPIRSLPRF